VNIIRAGSGLGDSFYLRSIAAEMLRGGEPVTVRSNYPDAFIGLEVKVEPFDRFGVTTLAHYTTRKLVKGSNQFQDMAISAGLGSDIPLSIDWTVRNHKLVEGLKEKADARPIVIVHGGRTPMERKDGFGAELLPSSSAFHAALAALDGCFLVQIGKAEQVYPIKADISLNGGTSVSDLMDLGKIADGFVAQVSFCVPLAEMFDKPLLVVWAADGMSPARHYYISSITPQKVLSKDTSCWVVDDWPVEQIKGATRAFRELF
jgi:hypothetical protein